MNRRIFSLLIVPFACIFFLCTPVLALPTLQLDIVGGTYDTFTETTVAANPLFTVRALLNGNTYLGDEFYLSAALLPRVVTPDPTIDVGSFTVDLIEGAFKLNGVSYADGLNIDVVGDMNYGIPPVDTEIKDLASHGIFPTYYAEFAFKFNSAYKTPAYNTDPRETNDNPTGYLYYRDFAVNVSGLDLPNIIHFDLYHIDSTKNKIDKFAPFSHDAESTSFPVPEPATMLLLGSGLVGLAGFRRKMRKK